MCHAAKKGDAKKLRGLLAGKAGDELKAAVNKEDGYSKKSPLHWAAERGHAECARMLIEAGADVHKEDGREDSKKSPLHWAAEGGHAECARMLIEAGADVHKEDGYEDSKKSPLHWAAAGGHAECARVLIEAGADVRTGGEGGRIWRAGVGGAAGGVAKSFVGPVGGRRAGGRPNEVGSW